jgi:hypothetical protein
LVQLVRTDPPIESAVRRALRSFRMVEETQCNSITRQLLAPLLRGSCTLVSYLNATRCPSLSLRASLLLLARSGARCPLEQYLTFFIVVFTLIVVPFLLELSMWVVPNASLCRRTCVVLTPELYCILEHSAKRLRGTALGRSASSLYYVVCLTQLRL